MDFGLTIPLIKNSIDVRSPGVRLSAYFINGFEHGSSNPLLEFELYNTDHLMLNLRHGGTTWMSSDLFHELQTWLVITEWSLRSLILARSTITLFFSTGSENRVAKPLIVPQTGFLLHSVKPLYAAALCVCVCPKLWSDVEMWRAKWIRNLSSAMASDIWLGSWPAGHCMLHLWSKRAIYFPFPAFSPLPALSCCSQSVFFYLNLIRLSLGPTSAVLSAAMQRFTDSLSREVLPVFTCCRFDSHLLWATFSKYKFLCKLFVKPFLYELIKLSVFY